MDVRQAWCLGFSVAITLAAIGSIATLTGGSLDTVLAADLESETAASSDGAGISTFSPVIDLPAVLQAGATTNIAIGLVGIDADTPPGSQPMIQVDLGLELVPAARGWIQIPRERHLLAAEDLHRRSFALQVAPAAPCGTIPGRITVTITAADGQGHTGQVRRLLPPIACDQLPPAAPASLHAPAGSCWEFDDDRPLAAAVVEPAGCSEPAPRRAPRPSTTPSPERPEPPVDEDLTDVEPEPADDADGDADDASRPAEDADDAPDEPSDSGGGNGDGGDGNGGDGNGGNGDGNGNGGNGDADEDGPASTSGSDGGNGSADDEDRTDS